jgi:TetR/AcrR family transcriptional regulator
MTGKKENLSTGEKIIRAAMTEFADNGFHGARIDSIARKAKVNKAMIYYHYKGKEALYEQILTAIAGDMLAMIKPLVPEGDFTAVDFEALIRGYSGSIAKMDEERMRIFLREHASGGKYFRKIIVPVLLQPVMGLVSEMFRQGSEKDVLAKDLNPFYTMIQIVGSMVFFNIMKISLKESPFVGERLFRGDYVSAYTENLIRICNGGIINRKG